MEEKSKHVAKILLVDDVSENLYSLQRIIEGPGREIICAGSGQEALKLALNNEFALILSDVQMPEMNGFEMLEILRTDDRNKQVPVIFVTAISKDTKYVHQGYSQGAVDYLFKPLDVDVVRSKVDIFVALYMQKELLKEQQEKLAFLNEEKNKFLGMAAHDLRNPIGVIQHYTQFLHEDLDDKIDTQDIDYIDMIQTASNHMMNLVDELLDLSRIESSDFVVDLADTDIVQLVKGCVKVNEIFAARKDTVIHLDIDESIPHVWVDAMNINMVLNNLIGNAIKYSQLGAQVWVTCKKSGDQLILSIKDNGPGIASDEIKDLFKAFSITSNKATSGEKSTGLGLAIVSKIVTAHNGTIDVKSEVGKGTEFVVKLSPKWEGPSDAEAIPSEHSKQDGERIKILYVDDNPMFHHIFGKLFGEYNIDLILANDGKEALELFKQEDGINCVFTDINMPKMDGYELTSALKKIDKNLLIIGLTGSISSEVRKVAMEKGMTDCYQKPISKQQIESFLKLYNERAVADS